MTAKTQGLSFIIGFLLISAAYAIGPTLPLRFAEALHGEDVWKITLQVDPSQMHFVKAERQIYRNGQKLRSEPIDVPLEKQSDGMLEGAIDLRFHGIEDLPSANYAQKIIAEGAWSFPQSKPLPIQRWFYFVVKEKSVRRIDADEYSRLTDPFIDVTDANGGKATAHTGFDVKTAVPLPRTKGTAAGSVGAVQGFQPETVPAKPNRKRVKKDESEKKEN